MIRVLVADDQALARGGFRMILESHAEIEVVGEAANGAEALRLASELLPDVVVMDIRMPGVDGLQATRRLLNQPGDHKPSVLMLTTFDHDKYVYEALKAGASGFLLKDVRPEQLVDAVLTVAAGEALLAPAITRRLIAEFVRRPPDRKRSPELERLTERELDVLRQVARGLANQEIAHALSVTAATVKTHVNHILSKLGLRDRTQAVVFAYESGLIEPGSD